MAYQIKQSTTAYELLFLMLDSTDHVTGKTGLSPTVTIRKAAGSFASPAGAVTEIANGWYKVAGNATDTGTLGPLLLHATGTGADPVDDRYEIVAFDPQDAVRLGITALPNAAAEASGGIVTRGTGTGQISVAGGRANADVTYWNAAAIATPDTAGYPKVTVKSGAGTGELDVTSGVVKSNLSAILGTALTQTYSIATAFKNFFDVLTARLTCGSYDLDGDLWTRVGSPATTTISADIQALKTVADDVPTTAEFNARTILSAEYSTAADLTAAKAVVDAVQAKTDQITFTVANRVDSTTQSGLSTLTAADVRTAVGLASANLDTQLTAIDDYLDTEVAAIKTKTDFLPSATAGAASGVAIVGSAMNLDDAEDIYPADIQCTIDETNERDEYTVQWFRNGAPVTSGVTVPLVQVIKRADGTDLIASTAMTQIGSTGAYKYDTTTTAERNTLGEAVLVHVSATINGSTRTWRKLVTRDSAEA